MIRVDWKKASFACTSCRMLYKYWHLIDQNYPYFSIKNVSPFPSADCIAFISLSIVALTLLVFFIHSFITPRTCLGISFGYFLRILSIAGIRNPSSTPRCTAHVTSFDKSCKTSSLGFSCSAISAISRK